VYSMSCFVLLFKPPFYGLTVAVPPIYIMSRAGGNWTKKYNNFNHGFTLIFTDSKYLTTKTRNTLNRYILLSACGG
jgi:hypothetical protein